GAWSKRMTQQGLGAAGEASPRERPSSVELADFTTHHAPRTTHHFSCRVAPMSANDHPPGEASLTPMMQQYRAAKEAHPGTLLLFGMGAFFESFDEDAELGHRLLGITLTQRDGHPMAGFPHHQLDNYLRKLLHAGHRVAVCDQVEDPAQAKGLVRREVTRVVTPGTLTEDGLLDPRRSNHLVALFPGRAAAGGRGLLGLAWLELSAGRFQAADVSWQRLADELGRLAPAECLLAENAPPAVVERLRDAQPQMLL